MLGDIKVYFSDYFDIEEDVIESYGAVNISLINDLPLFIDPFLLFNSTDSEYQKIHHEMIDYLLFRASPGKKKKPKQTKIMKKKKGYFFLKKKTKMVRVLRKRWTGQGGRFEGFMWVKFYIQRFWPSNSHKGTPHGETMPN